MKRRSVIVLLLIVVPLCTGCTTFVHNRFPVLERPERPQLANVPGEEMQKMSVQARQDVADNFNKLIDYTRKLEVAVDEYNAFAERKNQEFREGGP